MIEFNAATDILFEFGALDRLGAHAAPWGTRALLVTGRRSAREHGYTDRARASLTAAGIDTVVFDGVSANPLAAEVDAAAALARTTACDLVVGLGGGSALDAAKAAAVTAPGDRSAAALVGTTLVPGTPALPVVAVPTTAGSGSEVTLGAIVTDPVRRLRAGIRGEPLRPKAAVVDPELITSLPTPLALESVFDALAHAVEGYLAARATPATQHLSVQAIELILRSAPDLLRSRATASTYRNLSTAAVLGGLNVAAASTCLPHRLQQAMGVLPACSVSHGRGLAALYPAWLLHTEPHAPEAFAVLSDVFGGADLKERISDVTAAFGLASRLRDWGIDRSDLPRLVGAVVGNRDNDPAAPFGDDHLLAICEDSW